MKRRRAGIAGLSAIMLCCIAQFSFGAGECFDDPDACAGPRSWLLDFSEDLEFDDDGIGVGTTEGWQRRNGNSALPEVNDGKALFDGTFAPWTLIDTIDHYFEGVTTIHVKMDPNPADFEDLGAGWWVNADNEGNQGGFYAIFGELQRFEEGVQEYVFGPIEVADERIEVAEGPIDVKVTLTPNEDDEEMLVEYSITDIETTHTGEFTVESRQGPEVPIDDKWFTLFSHGEGQGIFDYVEVHNQPSTAEPGDYNADGVLDALDIDRQSAEMKKPDAEQDLATFDHNGDGVINVGTAGADESAWGDRLIWVRTLRGTSVGDSNFDGIFDSGDLVKVFAGGLYETDEMAGWELGDWNGDMIFDSGDLVIAFADGGYVSGATPAAVPEPSAVSLLVLGCLFVVRRRLSPGRSS